MLAAGVGQNYFLDSYYGIGIDTMSLKVRCPAFCGFVYLQVSPWQLCHEHVARCPALPQPRTRAHLQPSTNSKRSMGQVGSDCPDHAIYVDVAAVLDGGTGGATPDALCIFEDDLSETSWRHTNTGGG